MKLIVKYLFFLVSFSFVYCGLPTEESNVPIIEYEKENKLTVDSQTITIKQKVVTVDVIDFGRQSLRLSHKINTTSNEILPILSSDGNSLFFSAMDRKGFFDFKQDFIKAKNCGGEDIFFSTFENGVWSDARPITFLNTNAHECVSQVFDDNSLLLTGSYEENLGFSDNPNANTTDIFYAKKLAADYQIIHYDEPINSIFTEADGYLVENKYMLFVSDRPGHVGDYHKKGWSWNGSMWGNTDVWVSIFSQYNWQEPINLGNLINSTGAERSPWISDDGLTLYVSSNGYDSKKNDLDIYKFTRTDPDNWLDWSGPYKVIDACSDLDDWGYKLNNFGEPYFCRSLKLPFKSNQPGRSGDGGARETNYRAGYTIVGAQVGSYLKENQTDIFMMYSKDEPVFTIEDVLFEINKSSLSKKSNAVLDDLVDFIKLNNPQKIIIEGNTDNSGSNDYNLNLSLERAMSVKNYLIDNNIINNIEVLGNGEEKPLFPNVSKENKSKNRRVEIVFEN